MRAGVPRLKPGEDVKNDNVLGANDLLVFFCRKGTTGPKAFHLLVLSLLATSVTLHCLRHLRSGHETGTFRQDMPGNGTLLMWETRLLALLLKADAARTLRTRERIG